MRIITKSRIIGKIVYFHVARARDVCHFFDFYLCKRIMIMRINNEQFCAEYLTGWSGTRWRTAAAAVRFTGKNSSPAWQCRKATAESGFSNTCSLRPRRPSFQEPWPRGATSSLTYSTA